MTMLLPAARLPRLHLQRAVSRAHTFACAHALAVISYTPSRSAALVAHASCRDDACLGGEDAQ